MSSSSDPAAPTNGVVTRTGRVLRCTVSSAARHGTLEFAQLREVTAALLELLARPCVISRGAGIPPA